MDKDETIKELDKFAARQTGKIIHDAYMKILQMGLSDDMVNKYAARAFAFLIATAKEPLSPEQAGQLVVEAFEANKEDVARVNASIEQAKGILKSLELGQKDELEGMWTLPQLPGKKSEGN